MGGFTMAYMFDEDKSMVNMDDDAQAQITALGNALGSLKVKIAAIDAGEEKYFTCTNGTRATIILQSASTNGNGMSNINCSSNSSVNVANMIAATGNYVFGGTGQFVIRNQTSVATVAAIFIYTGEVNAI